MSEREGVRTLGAIAFGAAIGYILGRDPSERPLGDSGTRDTRWLSNASNVLVFGRGRVEIHHGEEQRERGEKR